MGRVASRLTKPIRTFNIENRARRALEKQHDQGIASPKHPSTQDQIAQIQRNHPEYLAEQQEKNELLHEKLKGLYVEGQHTPQVNAYRPLPESRTANPDTELGSMETFHQVPEGRANLKTILYFIGQHQINPEQVTVQSIAQEYKLNEEDVAKVLNHFKALTFHIPQEMYKQNPNLKKIVAEQINSAASSVAQFRLSLPKENSKTDPNDNKT